jgi:hypothetical protein
VQGKPGLGQTNWTTVSPTLTAVDVLTTYCVSLASTNRLFRVAEGLVVTPYFPPVYIRRVALETNGVLLEWSAPTNTHFQAQWTPSLFAPAWMAFTNILSSTNGEFSFLDDGSQSGGLAGPRYYRLEQLP